MSFEGKKGELLAARHTLMITHAEDFQKIILDAEVVAVDGAPHPKVDDLDVSNVAKKSIFKVTCVALSLG